MFQPYKEILTNMLTILLKISKLRTMGLNNFTLFHKNSFQILHSGKGFEM